MKKKILSTIAAMALTLAILLNASISMIGNEESRNVSFDGLIQTALAGGESLDPQNFIMDRIGECYVCVPNVSQFGCNVSRQCCYNQEPFC